MGRVFKDIGVWMLLWLSGWGIYYLLLSYDINYITAPCTSALYFSAASAAVLLLYKDLLPFVQPLTRPLPWRLQGKVGPLASSFALSLVC